MDSSEFQTDSDSDFRFPGHPGPLTLPQAHPLDLNGFDFGATLRAENHDHSATDPTEDVRLGYLVNADGTVNILYVIPSPSIY